MYVNLEKWEDWGRGREAEAEWVGGVWERGFKIFIQSVTNNDCFGGTNGMIQMDYSSASYNDLGFFINKNIVTYTFWKMVIGKPNILFQLRSKHN